jgi:hypothetical protein
MMRTCAAMVLAEAVRTVSTTCGCALRRTLAKDRRVNSTALDVPVGASMPVLTECRRTQEKQSEQYTG